MAEPTKKTDDDFFTLLKKEEGKKDEPMEPIVDPFAKDEVIFKDTDGQFKTLKNGQVAALAAESPVVSLPASDNKSSVMADYQSAMEKETEKIITDSGVILGAEALNQRLKNIIQTNLRGLRDQVQTKEMLMDLPLTGGVGLGSDQADKILKIAGSVRQASEEKSRRSVGQEPFADLQAEVSEILKSSQTKELPKLVFNQPPSGQVKPAAEIKPVEKIVEPVSPPLPNFKNFARPASPAISTRPKIEDIKFKPRLTGPIEEIKAINLTDFRRLAVESASAAQSVFEKIKLLEQDSFPDLIEGIRAWKQSEVNQLYLEIGHQSLAEKVSVDQIIDQRKAAGQPFLSAEEFEAIGDLNKKLRY